MEFYTPGFKIRLIIMNDTRHAQMTYDMIYLLNEIGFTAGGSSTVQIYTQIIHRTTQSTYTIHRTTQLTGKSAGRVTSLRVIPWQLPCN